jgi:hypothetical protein
MERGSKKRATHLLIPFLFKIEAHIGPPRKVYGYGGGRVSLIDENNAGVLI